MPEVFVEDLLVAVAALLAFAVAGFVHAKRRKQEVVAALHSQPGQVARLYLRPAETGAFWLHAQLKDGRKSCIAAPWEVDETLEKLAALGLRLGAEDHEALGEYRRSQRTPGAEPTRTSAPAPFASAR